jgi:hypothetical protein
MLLIRDVLGLCCKDDFRRRRNRTLRAVRVENDFHVPLDESIAIVWPDWPSLFYCAGFHPGDLGFCHGFIPQEE